MALLFTAGQEDDAADQELDSGIGLRLRFAMNNIRVWLKREDV